MLISLCYIRASQPGRCAKAWFHRATISFLCEEVLILEERTDLSEIFIKFDSTMWSPIMRLFLPDKRLAPIGLPRYAVIWLVCSALTYLPAFFWNVALNYQTWGTDAPVALPYLHDVNLTMMLVVCLPALIISHLREAHLLPQAMSQLVAQGTAIWKRSVATEFVDNWQRIYRKINALAILIGIGGAILVIWINYMALQDNYGKSWQTAHMNAPQVNMPGWFFLIVQIGLFWFLLTYQFVRMFGGMALLTSYARSALIRVNPLHPDRVGGLRPVARIGIQNQLIVAIVGVNIGSLFVVLQMLGEATSIWIGVIASIAYLIIAPIVFVGPLIPFRPHMLRSKAEYLHAIADQFRDDLEVVLRYLNDDQASSTKLEKLERLSAVHARIARLPEWPLDTTTIRRFGATLLTPAVSVLISWLFKKIIEGS